MGRVGLKLYFAAHPPCTFPRHSLLLQLIAQAHFKFCAIKAFLTFEPRDIKFLAFLRRFLGGKGWGGKDEAQFVTGLQLRL